MRVLGLDQALVTTGWSIHDGRRLVASGTFTVKPTNDGMGRRLNDIMRHLTELHNEYEFDRVYFEDIQMQASVVTYCHLAYVQAAVILWCYYNQMPYRIYSPSTWRSVVGGNFGRKRDEQKATAIQRVRDLYEKDVSSDEADAILIGLAGILDASKAF